jgi:TonB-dependent receptor
MCLGSAGALAQDQDASQELEEVVVTGFRGSLNTAIAAKRRETAAIDVIASEDIGKFPDSNLAESMQRVPGVALSRSDGGEGRNISVRGLGAGFTKVRINGMEGAAQTGSSDIYGAGNNGRAFDFNVFPTEIFSQLSVRKTASADVEEGSLGATVDLKAPSAFDYDQDQVFSITGRGIYNEIVEDVDPRVSMLASKKFFDDTFGALATFSFQERHTREVGYSAVDILHFGTNANNIGTGTAPILLPFCTPIGWTLTAPSPVPGTRGATGTDCSTGNARTSDMAAFMEVYNRTNAAILDAAGNPVPGGGAFHPRLPRYVNSEQDTERAGGSISLQWRPSENTSISLDGLYSRYEQERRDNYILALSFGRNISNLGQPQVSIRDVEFDEDGSLTYGLFDGVDVRSEGLVDRFISTFEQLSLDMNHQVSDNFAVHAYAGRSINTWDGPLRFQTFIDAIDTDNFSVDFRNGGSVPVINFGFDVSNPANFLYAPSPASTSPEAGSVYGGFSLQGKPQQNITANNTFELDGTFQISDVWKVKVGAQYRESHYSSHGSNPLRNAVLTRALPAGTSISDLTTQISGLDSLFGSGAPASWAAIDMDKWDDVFDIDSVLTCGQVCGAAQSKIFEDVQTGYAMFAFDSGDRWSIPIRGDFGVRYVMTDQWAEGNVSLTAPGTSPFTAFGQLGEVERDYSDTLPSFNLVFELSDNLLARLSGSKVMSRPELGNLAPTSGVTATTRTGNVNNPFLDPIRADTADLALEWYFAEGSLLSVAYFYKDIETFIQRITEQVPYRDLGLPDSLLDGSPASPTDIFTVGRFQNTPGGELTGFELNAQVQFNFLPGAWSNFGVLANYTKVDADITYFISATSPPVTAQLVGMSPTTAAGTLYYENDRFSVRTTASYRDKYFRAIPASPGSDVRGDLATTYMDAQASWFVNDNLTILLEAQNLTGERSTLYIDDTREDTLFETEIGTTYTLGATFKF